MSSYTVALEKFYNQYIGYAENSEKETGVPALVTLAQAAIESGWGAHAPGFNFFGIKADPSWNGMKQLLPTKEHHTNANVHYPVIRHIVKTGPASYEYDVDDYFRVYESPEGSFSDHGHFLRSNRRYANAFETGDPILFAELISKDGYATALNYAKSLKKIISDFNVLINKKTP